MQSSPSDSLLLVFSFHCFLLHLTLTFTWFIPRLRSHSSCQANKRLFAFPWRLMPRPGRETECREAGGKPVAGGYQKGRIDVCWLRLGGNSGWWNRWRVVTSVTIKLGPTRLQPKASNPVATISTVLSMLRVCAWAVTPITQQTCLKHTVVALLQSAKKSLPVHWSHSLSLLSSNGSSEFWLQVE